jgi:excinuclease UvrABC nuclease subunit
MPSTDDIRREVAAYSITNAIAPAPPISDFWNIVASLKKGESVPFHTSPGCYVFYTEPDEVIYIGVASTTLGTRIAQYFHSAHSTNPGAPKHEMPVVPTKLRTIPTATKEQAWAIEEHLIRALRPPSNKMLTK